MPEESELVLQVFAAQQRRLTDLLSVTHRPYIASPGEGSPSDSTIEPNVRTAKVAAKVLPYNPYFKEYARQARQVLGLPQSGVD